MVDEAGNILTLDAFGEGTFGLSTVVDGRETEFRLVLEVPKASWDRAAVAADDLLRRLRTGWRPPYWFIDEDKPIDK